MPFYKGLNMLKVHWNNAPNEQQREFVEARFKRELLKQVDFNEDTLKCIHDEAIKTRNPNSSMQKIFAIAHLNTFWGMNEMLPSEKNNSYITIEFTKE